MSEHYDFHYQPTGSGAISGQQVLQQTEDAINELGDYVNDNVGGAMDVAQQALETAQTAETNAQTALDTANSFSGAIQSAQQDASTALSTAQTAQTTASNANNTAVQAQQDASSAVTTANNASGQVNTLSGTVTALGQRVTTAEGNIGQNTSDITALTNRVGTAEGNITTLQNDVTIAQGNASSAMATAGTVKQQAYVFRYSSTTLVASSTNSNTLLDNTDNLKVGDKVIDSSGVLFSITAIDTANSTFTVGSALIDLALDSDVVHKSGDETISGDKVFNNRLIKNIDVVLGTTPSTGKFSNIEITDNNKASLLQILGGVYGNGSSYARFFVQNKTADDGTGLSPTGTLRSCGFNINLPATSTAEGQGSITPRGNKTTDFGLSSYQWRNLWCEKLFLNGTQLNPSAFVTTDTAQTISGAKTLTDTLTGVALDCSRIRSKDDSQAYIVFRQSNQNNPGSIVLRASDGTGTSLHIIGGSLRAYTDNTVSLGTSSVKWTDVNTYAINGLNPSSLGMPDLDNGIDISSYITVNGGNKESLYTPPSNGWISVVLTRTGGANMAVMLKQGNFASSGHNIQQENGTTTCNAMLPVKGGVQVSINSALADGIAFAYFYPCLGNV